MRTLAPLTVSEIIEFSLGVELMLGSTVERLVAYITLENFFHEDNIRQIRAEARRCHVDEGKFISFVYLHVALKTRTVTCDEEVMELPELAKHLQVSVAELPPSSDPVVLLVVVQRGFYLRVD